MQITKLKTQKEEDFVELETFYTTIIPNSETKKLLLQLKKYPIPSHIKRIKKVDKNNLQVIICSTTQKIENQFKNIKIEFIPITMPLTTEQYEIAKIFWPTNYHNYVDKIDIEEVIKNYEKFYKNFDFNFENICSSFCFIVYENRIVYVSYDSDNVLGHSVLKAVSSISRAKENYLCTGMDAYLFYEPCLSCAMAFVHGRIKNVFFLKFSENGGLSKYKLNTNESTNHRYSSYFVELNRK